MNTQPEALRLADALEQHAEWEKYYGPSCLGKELPKAAAELRRLQAERDELLEALKALLARDERNTCQHESTFRGGGIWEICDGCGRRWANDEGGRPDWVNPPEWKALRLADALEQQFPVGTAQHFLDGEAATELRLLHGKRVELLSVAAQALEALEYAEKNHGGDDCYSDAIDALRAAIEQENKQ